MATLAPSTALTPKFEFIFHGTGTSSSVPNIACITADPITSSHPRQTCGSTLNPQGFKNKRRNTGGILRIPGDGEDGSKVIVIDVGKTFLAAAHDLFPRYGLRRIDAVILTHPHADAMNGLDDLRGWTLGGSIQKHIDLYVSAFTFKEVQKSFPYLVAKEFATGGGDIPEFKWHIIKENEPFRVEGLDFDITPIAVHHGRLFTDEAEVPGNTPTPYDTPGGSGATTPSRSQPCPGHKPTPLDSSQNGSTESLDFRPAGLVSSAESKRSLGPKYINSSLASHVRSAPPKIRPYMCFGFVLGDFMVYMSDVSHIPDDAWRTIESAIHTTRDQSILDELPEVTPALEQVPQVRRFKVLVVDCLKLEPHTSHFGILDAASTARRINAYKTYMVGFGHRIPHSDWELIGEYLEGKELDKKAMERPYVLAASQILPPQQGVVNIWLRPAYDGLRLFANDSEAWEDSIE